MSRTHFDELGLELAQIIGRANQELAAATVDKAVLVGAENRIVSLVRQIEDKAREQPELAAEAGELIKRANAILPTLRYVFLPNP